MFGSYRVQALLAAGGMGEVYRAVDTQLHRTVAIKVLPEHLSDHPERRERFRREALLISSLNHPHICALYHVGTADDVDYLVMEYIDGETLQDRLKRGRMHWEEALNLLIEIADALVAAHRQGIVHRDLKPANVMLTKGGVKVLDFGLAARRAPRDGSALDPALAGAKQLTVEGRIMGTVPYMAPEQLQGKPTDARTDVFAFGAVAYEILTGKPAFSADSQADLIGAILGTTPSQSRRPRRTFRSCWREPLPDASPRILTNGGRQPLTCSSNCARSPSLRACRCRARRAVAGRIDRSGCCGLEPLRHLSSLGSICGVAAAPRDAPPTAPAGAFRFSLSPPAGTTFPSSFDVPFALSPDGRWIVYVAAREDGTRQLWLRSLESAQELPLPGTEGAASPFWKPDSEWVAFFCGHAEKGPRHESCRAGHSHNDVDDGRRGLEPQRRHRVPRSGWAAPRVGEWRTGLNYRR